MFVLILLVTMLVPPPYHRSSVMCNGCGLRYGVYMVFDHVWAAAQLEKKDNVCPLCLAKRLRRPLIDADLVRFDCNNVIREHGVLASVLDGDCRRTILSLSLDIRRQ